MKICILSIILMLSFKVSASEQCNEMNVSGVKFFSAIDIVDKKLGPFASREYFEDAETSGQNSGWKLSKLGLEVFVADIGGLTYAKATDPNSTIAFKFRVGEKYLEVHGGSNVELFPCTDMSITEQKITLSLTPDSVIKSITIEDYGL